MIPTMALDALLPQTDDGGVVLASLITAVGGVLGLLIQRNTNVSRKAAQAAQKTERQTEKTGNGYATRTEAQLQFLVTEISLIRADQRGMHEDVRGVSRRVDRVAERLDHHLAEGQQS